MSKADPMQSLKTAKQAVVEGRHSEALSQLRANFCAETEFSAIASAARWARKVTWPGQSKLRVAFLGGGTLEHFVDMVEFWLLLDGIHLEPYLASFDTWRQDILDANSRLYEFKPDIVWIFTGRRDLRLDSDNGSSLASVQKAVDHAVSDLSGLWDVLQSRLPATIFQNNADSARERVFGNFEATAIWSDASKIRRFNLSIAEAAAARGGTFIFDLAHVAETAGLQRWQDARYWFHSKHPFAPEMCGFVGFHAARAIHGAKGLSKKCLVLDLDNTLWGGVIGDDGMDGIRLGDGADGEAFTAFQNYLKALGDRGIILTVSSKNTESIAREPFEKHPGMGLRLNDIAVFKANWKNKADNIREIAAVLNIGMDSMVFLDDNPAERALIRSELPMVTTPEMPEDPADYIATLDRLRLFETVAFSEEDRARGQMYRENAMRAEAQSSFTNVSEYLKSLEMFAEVGIADPFHLPRMAQLINKSNQFHPTTTRYTEAELTAMAANPEFELRWFSLRDKFGDNGLIASLVLKRVGAVCWIDTWAMSCRVLSRGMEEFICRTLIAIAKQNGAGSLCGRYLPTKKNGLVAELYGRLGFTKVDTDGSAVTWKLDLAQERAPTELFIELHTPQGS